MIVGLFIILCDAEQRFEGITLMIRELRRIHVICSIYGEQHYREDGLAPTG